MTPYETLYGRTPPLHVPYVLGHSTVDAQLTKRESVVVRLKHQLQRSQNRVKQYVDNRCTKRRFSTDELIFLKLQPFR